MIMLRSCYDHDETREIREPSNSIAVFWFACLAAGLRKSLKDGALFSCQGERHVFCTLLLYSR